MLFIPFSQICRALNKIKLPECDLVVGISDGGTVPASLTAAMLGCDLKIVKFSYRGPDNAPIHPEPKCLNGFVLPAGVKKVLLVDDVSVSGKTLVAAARLLKDCRVVTFVFKGQADHVLFPEIKECVDWPWKA